MIPIPRRATPCGRPRATRWWRCRAARPTPQKSSEPAEPVDRWKGVAEPGSALAAGLDAIVREDKTFDPKHFLTGARAAYDMIVTAYAAGDRRQLKNLLGREVYDGFEAAIKERETARRDRRDAVRIDRRRQTSSAPKRAARPRR